MDDQKFQNEPGQCEPIVGGQDPERNELCSCGSGLKYKHCHGDPAKCQLVTKFATAFLMGLIRREQMKRGIIPYPYTCKACGKGFNKPEQGVVSNLPLCPHCKNTNIVKNESQLIGGNG